MQAKGANTHGYIYKQKEQVRKQNFKEAAQKGVEFDFLNDYSSSDYDNINEDEKEYMMRYQQENFNKFDQLKRQLQPSPTRRGKLPKKQATQVRESSKSKGFGPGNLHTMGGIHGMFSGSESDDASARADSPANKRALNKR